jgi:uncharacterized DUF497 family protein
VLFEWDEAKRDANIVNHGVDFADALEIFRDPQRIERADERGRYGEERRQVIGRVGPEILFVVYTLRRGMRRHRPGAPGRRACAGGWGLSSAD